MQVKEERVRRAKVGVFGIGLQAYWEQFDGLQERLEGCQWSVEERWATVVSPGLVDTAQKAPAAFMNAWSEQGPTHHCALGVGHHAGTLSKVARLLSLEFVEVGRS
jgi:L-arabinose isomerase